MILVLDYFAIDATQDAEKCTEQGANAAIVVGLWGCHSNDAGRVVVQRIKFLLDTMLNPWEPD